MTNELLGPFKFCVYDDVRQMYVLSTSGVHLDSSNDIWNVGAVATVPTAVPQLGSGVLRIEFKHAVGTLPIPSTDSEEFGIEVAGLFCALAQGTVLGWNIISNDVEFGASTPSEIQVGSFIQPEQFRQILSELNLDAGGRRRLLREDILSFAAQFYESKGSSQAWSTADFRNEGYSRVPFLSDSVESVLEDLIGENKLTTTFEGKSFSLNPSCYDELAARRSTALANWLGRLRTCVAKHKLDQAEPETKGTSEMVASQNDLRVFIIHGHDEAKRRELKDLLEKRLGLDGVILQEQPGKSRTIIEKFEEEASGCNAAIALVTDDDIIQTANGEEGQPRANVMFELGWFAGKYGRHRTLMVVRQGAHIPSDLG